MITGPVHPLRSLFKGLLLFIFLNLIFAAWHPSSLGKISLYNHLFPGRDRFPFGENPAQSYNLSLFDLDSMFASHTISAGSKPANEYRVIVIGDSSVWGTLLHPEETLTGQLDRAHLNSCDGRKIRFYNLGYPTISLAKDLMVLDYGMHYHPDLIIWPITLEAFPKDRQLASPIVAHNTGLIQALIAKYNLLFDPHDPSLVQQNFWEKSILGQRRGLADLLRLQVYGVMWAATGIDQVYPTEYPHAQTDFDADVIFHNMQPPELNESLLAFDVLDAGLQLAGDTPVILVNEPILVSTGKNSDLKYDFFYPRWAYDRYRQMMNDRAYANGLNYLDLWNLLPASQFTNSAIHLTPAGESLLAERIEKAILQQTCHGK